MPRFTISNNNTSKLFILNNRNGVRTKSKKANTNEKFLWSKFPLLTCVCKFRWNKKICLHVDVRKNQLVPTSPGNVTFVNERKSRVNIISRRPNILPRNLRLRVDWKKMNLNYKVQNQGRSVQQFHFLETMSLPVPHANRINGRGKAK